MFTLIKVPLNCPEYTCISKLEKFVNVSFKTLTTGEIAPLVIKHGQGKCSIYSTMPFTGLVVVDQMSTA
ncbi:MAG: hypothetical protein G5663_02225 [Serratia symbiotica]|nr:hypothetical protein [Serratia symbiotica]